MKKKNRVIKLGNTYYRFFSQRFDLADVEGFDLQELIDMSREMKKYHKWQRITNDFPFLRRQQQQSNFENDVRQEFAQTHKKMK